MHLIILRHARSTANSDGILAGRNSGIHLDDIGREQAEGLMTRLQGIEISAIYGSPLTRCRETAEALCIDRRLAYNVDERLNEVDYGAWSGKALKELSEDSLWGEIQSRPTSVQFPEGEQLASVFDRASEFLISMQALDEGQTVLAVTHGDVAKAMISVALAAPADQFQRIVIDPCSISLLRVTEEKAFVLRLNDSGTSVKEMLGKSTNQGVVGGGR